MSITLKIDRNELDKEDMILYLQEVIEEIEKGSRMGEDWDITGKEEKLEDFEEDSHRSIDDDMDDNS